MTEKERLFIPFIWDTDPEDEALFSTFENGILEHPFKMGKGAVTYLYLGLTQNRPDLLRKGELLLNLLLDFKEREKSDFGVIYYYPLDYTANSGVKWKSAQCNATIAVGFLLGYEIFDQSDYLDEAIGAMNAVTQPYHEGGLSLEFNDSCSWFLTNTYDGQGKLADNNFIHNHQLLSLNALLYFKLVLPNESYHSNFIRGVNAINNLGQEFFLRDYSWTYYMVEKKNLEPLHYFVYNQMILTSILFYKNNEGLREIFDYRQEILKDRFAIHKYGDVLYQNIIGGPTFFNNDIYSLRLESSYNSKVVETLFIDPTNYDSPYDQKYFVEYNEIEVDSVQMIMINNGIEFPLLWLKVDPIKERISGYINSVIEPEKSVSLQENSVLKTDAVSGMNRIQMTYKFPITVDFSGAYFFGWSFESEKIIESIEIKLINSYNEASIFNHFGQPDSTRNLVLLSPSSFQNYSEFKSKRIKAITVNYYFLSEVEEQCAIHISDIFWTNDRRKIMEILSGKYGDFKLNENKYFGGLY
ncbi:MAG: D-glucuronyl C5-epimerase family protein [Crocinitomicaceae bacterium]|nr:D-glucuronyl C5-epimerase family protein [Crocinitomicaceae bacterium]